jgi:hypothetical protein
MYNALQKSDFALCHTRAKRTDGTDHCHVSHPYINQHEIAINVTQLMFQSYREQLQTYEVRLRVCNIRKYFLCGLRYTVWCGHSVRLISQGMTTHSAGKTILFVAIAAMLSSCAHSFYQQKYTDFGHRKGHYEPVRSAHDPKFSFGTDSSAVWCVGPDTISTSVPVAVAEPERAVTIAPAPLADPPVLVRDSVVTLQRSTVKSDAVVSPAAPAPGLFFGLWVLLAVLFILGAIILGLGVNPVVGVICAGIGISLLIILLKRRARPKQLYIPDSGGSNEELPENERKPAPEMTDRELAEKNIRALGIIACVLAAVLIVVLFSAPIIFGLIPAIPLLIMLLLHRVWINRLKRIVNPRRNPNEKRIRILDLINWIAMGLAAVLIAIIALLS